MKTILKSILVAFAVLFSLQTSAQQDPQYTQYMYNLSVINPAYAGSKEVMNLGVLYRSQWSKLDGAPETGTLFFHTPLNEKIGLGVSAITETLGPVEETNVYADGSYTINVAKGHKLAFGLKAGLTLHQVSLAGLTLQDENDLAFSTNGSDSFFNLGTGIFYYTDKYYFSASIPNLLNSQHLDVNGVGYGSEENHFFIAGGYVFDITPSVKLKPSFLYRSTWESPKSVDANLNARFYDKFEVGASWRLNDSFSALINVDVYPWMKVGFAYDAVTSEINEVAPSSFEGFVIFSIFPGTKPLRSPRFF